MESRVAGGRKAPEMRLENGAGFDERLDRVLNFEIPDIQSLRDWGSNGGLDPDTLLMARAFWGGRANRGHVLIALNPYRVGAFRA